MKIRSITGEDDINSALMGAMEATIEKLRIEKLLTESQAEQFLREHLIFVANGDGGFKAWLKRIWPNTKDDNAHIIVSKVDY
jgi:adenine-specific DNA methylase